MSTLVALHGSVSALRRARAFLGLLVPLPSVVLGRLSNLVFFWFARLSRPGRRAAPVPRSFPPGVNLAGYLRSDIGLGQAARGVAAALAAAELPFAVVDFEIGHFGSRSDMRWRHRETRRPSHDVTVLVVNPDNIGTARLWLPRSLFAHRYVIGYWFWEMPEVPAAWLPAFSLVDEVWVASRYVAASVGARSPVPVTLVPPVVLLGDGAGGTSSRRSFGLPGTPFLFLTACDASSVVERKNPLGAIRAFKKAFDRNDPRVGLVVKVRQRNPFRRDMQAVRREVEGWPNIHLLEQSMSRDEIHSLLAVTDCFVSLHRAEGFGLMPAEAMRLGKPVILTRWSGNADYMTADNSIGIDCTLVPINRNHGPYQRGQLWAEPDIDQAAGWMAKLSGDHDLGRAIGGRGRETVDRTFSPRAVGEVIRRRLAEIRAQRG